jgi:alpha-glucosidase (family GH31 glycosyl hydrolase)
MDKYSLPSDPVGEASSMVKGPQYRFTLINDVVLRYEWAEDGVFEDRPSTFAINRRFPSPEFTTNDTGDYLEIRTSTFHVTYNKKRFDRYGFIISFSDKNTLWGADWRYGEATPENLGGTARTLDNVDGRCDLETGVLSKAGYSVLDDSRSMLFDSTGFASPRRPGDRIDGYLFCYGRDFKRAMSSFFAISGKQPLLPRWALGNWWSRYYAYTDREYLELMGKFETRQVPLSVAVIDMDWHQVSGDHIPHAGWTGYSWNKKLFPDPPGFTKALHDKNLKITLNDHPHAGIHRHEDMYETMARDIGHDTSSGAPMLFDPTSPKFMHAYLNTLHRQLEKEGCDFWWIDWQQGPYSRIPGLDPLWLLNHFHFLDHAQQQGEDGRGIIFSRFGGPGSHRYPVGFSGDTIMTWESLQFQPEFTATASNIGYGWWSHDIGGHMGGYRDDELATRWVQYGVFSPIMRLHSSANPWGSKEPWLFREEYKQVMEKFLQFRHRLIPYLHTMNALSAFENEPLVQPIYWKHPEQEEAYGQPNQFYFGSSLLVAPIVKPRDKRTNTGAVDVWIPRGRWIDIFNGMIYQGNKSIRMHRKIHEYPVLAPMGAIIPLDMAPKPKNGGLNPSGLELLVVVGDDGDFTIREEIQDDEPASPNSTGLREIMIGYVQAKGQLRFAASSKQWRVKFLGLALVPEQLSVSAGGQALANVNVTVDAYPAAPGLVVELPMLSEDSGEIVIDIGAQPALHDVTVSERISDYVLDVQIDMGLKEKVGKIFEIGGGLLGQIGKLAALGLDEGLTGPLMEYMLADIP